MEKLSFGLAVSVIGMLIVFIGLIVLIGCITLLRKIAKEKPSVKKVPAEQKVIAAPARELPVASSKEKPCEVEELIAVLTAAIASLWDGEQGFVVRRVRRVHLSPAWEKAGREEQIYSRM